MVVEQHPAFPTIALVLSWPHSVIRTARSITVLVLHSTRFVEPQFWTPRYLSDVVRLSIGILSYIFFPFSPPPPPPKQGAGIM